MKFQTSLWTRLTKAFHLQPFHVTHLTFLELSAFIEVYAMYSLTLRGVWLAACALCVADTGTRSSAGLDQLTALQDLAAKLDIL